MKKVVLYTDGACSGNPGPGGWGALLMYGKHSRELSGFEAQTTNNRMEIQAVIGGLSALKEPCMVDLYTDSAYVCNAFEKHWIAHWQTNGWKTAGRTHSVSEPDYAVYLPTVLIYGGRYMGCIL